MRTLLSIVMMVTMAGCGGNWSNSDLVFSNALPRAADLRSSLPAASSTQPLEGVSTRRDGLMVGDQSNAWALTRQASRDFNGVVDALLGIVDQIRKVAPTSRTSTSRTWGPFSDSNNPGRELQVMIERVDEQNFAWRVQSRPNNGQFIDVISGSFLANDSSTARKGRGTIEIPVAGFRDVVKTDAKFSVFDKITIAYVTDMFPKSVDIDFELRAGAMPMGLSALGYTATVREDGSGTMRFLFSQDDPGASEIEITTGFKSTGEGRGLGIVRKGTWVGLTVVECWGPTFTVTHYAENWPAGQVAGAASSCVAIDGF